MDNIMVIDGLDEIEIQNTPIDDINSEVVNLIMVEIDNSGSMEPYKNDMITSLNNFRDALQNSKEADEMLVARANFSSNIQVGGYKKIDQFDVNYSAGGMTAMYDAIVKGADELFKYMEYLKQQGMRVKAVFSIFSDGEENSSRATLQEAKSKIKELNDKEVVTAFISFGSDAMMEAKRLGVKNILQVGSSASELRKAFDCLSKSVIDASKSVVSKKDDFFTI
jgi:uncharacterized protein YegL